MAMEAKRVRGTGPQGGRSSRLGLRATPEQESVLAAEQTLLDQRLFLVSGESHQSFLDLLEGPAQDNEGLRDLFSRPSPWEGA